MTLAEIDHLTLRIPTHLAGRRAHVHAATGVSLTVTAGRIHALVGESGCGKSVLASTLSGLLPPGTLVSGRLVVDGDDVTSALGHPRHPAWRRLRGRVVGSVAQSPATAFTPTRTIGSQIDEVITALNGSRTADDLAAAAKLPPWALAAYPHELSGGLAARAALAAALAGQPPILVADEPTVSVDPDLARQVLGLLRAQADSGVAVLLITHDVAALLDRGLADEVSVMYAGRIVEHGPASQVWAAPSHAYTRALLAALPRYGLHAVHGEPPVLTDLDASVQFEDRLPGAS